MSNLKQAGDVIKAVVSINNTLVQITRKYETELGLTFLQLAIVNTISFHQGGTLKQVSEQLSLSKSTASTQVDQLVTKGMIRRENSKTDRRETLLSLTEQGTEAAKKSIMILPFYQATTEQLATKDPEDVQTLIDTLEQLLEQLQDLKGENK
ncbi:transcriptional regulator [Listeria weihenstephanensis FSL R9-0317]|uniref:MarR family winged helix-turn-helix transcriptional regulator n=1 Tax=Listeria weihenstephanensis TaxID=1006155 RepID=UPI0003E8511F|nr:MarR family transcriptional regulator [Listeria weihenstephanensis]EUJ38756.1 transcriptional regulator [Listeria weihenstephanensis FSL R9-0317]